MSSDLKRRDVLRLESALRTPSVKYPQVYPGFDKAMHKFVVKGTTFIVDKHYHLKKSIGSGAYGVVCSADDKKRSCKVAIKKVTNAFDDVVDAKRILREIKLLAHFRHDNICGLVDLIPPRSRKDLQDVYMVLDYMETDLHKIIYSKNSLTEEHCQYFVYQVLRALKYMHSSGVIHRDLKPSNLLLNQNCDLKICDFGLARAMSAELELTEYVVTRWYRAPEIMCSSMEYDEKIDVWSVGCILAELALRKPLFPGDHYIHQLNLIFALLGTPEADDLKWISNDKALQYITNLKPMRATSLRRYFPKLSTDGLDLLGKMLKFNPHKRISVDDALRHPFLKSLHDPKNEPTCSRKFDFGFENDANTEKNIKDYIYTEVMAMREKIKRAEQARAAVPLCPPGHGNAM